MHQFKLGYLCILIKCLSFNKKELKNKQKTNVKKVKFLLSLPKGILYMGDEKVNFKLCIRVERID